jgi:two-component system, NarL family, sensor histidine kinase DevS
MVVLTREQIEERLAALHRASLELVGNLSLETLLERIVSLAKDQVDARYAALGVLNSQGELEKFIPVGMEESEIARIAHPPRGYGLIGAILREKRTIRVKQIAEDERSEGFPEHHPQMSSFLGVPILLDDNLLGQIYLTDKITYPEFTQDDEYVIETLAAYAAVAINNARMYENLVVRDRALVQRNTDLALLNDVATALAGTMEVEEVLTLTLERVMDYLNVEAGEIFLREEDNDTMKLALHRGESADAFTTKEVFYPGEGFIGTVAKTGKPMVTQAPQYDFRYIRRAVVEEGFRCIACIPLLAHGNVVGVLGVATRRERSLDQRELNLLMALGTLTGVSIENSRLNRQARRAAVLEERERIGMDLHDGTIQSIYAVGLALEYARISLHEDPEIVRQKIDQAIEGLNNAIREIRTFILDLRPRDFAGEDLLEGLQRLVDEFHDNTRTEVLLTGSDDGKINLPFEHADVLYHICQEALSNVAKHAQAEKVTIQLWKVPERILLEIADDGMGFDLRKVRLTLGHGLSNMNTRARKVGGDVEITSEIGKGTTILAWVPVHRNDNLYQSK